MFIGTCCFWIIKLYSMLSHIDWDFPIGAFFLLSFTVFSDLCFSSFNNWSHAVVTAFLELFVQKRNVHNFQLDFFLFLLTLLWSFMTLLMGFLLGATCTYHGKVSWQSLPWEGGFQISAQVGNLFCISSSSTWVLGEWDCAVLVI